MCQLRRAEFFACNARDDNGVSYRIPKSPGVGRTGQLFSSYWIGIMGIAVLLGSPTVLVYYVSLNQVANDHRGNLVFG